MAGDSTEADGDSKIELRRGGDETCHLEEVSLAGEEAVEVGGLSEVGEEAGLALPGGCHTGIPKELFLRKKKEEGLKMFEPPNKKEVIKCQMDLEEEEEDGVLDLEGSLPPGLMLV